MLDPASIRDPSMLAIDGGVPAIPEGPPSWPLADEDVRLALETAFADGSWGRYDGSHARRLVGLMQAMHGLEHVLLCSSGTIAVELALRGVKVGAGDEVALAAYDFAGNFRAIEAVDARPVLVDLAVGSWTIDVESLRQAIGERTKALIVSHLHGTLADMPAIMEICRAAGVSVIEDACQTPGAVVGGKVAGSWGDVGIHSFGGSKLLTAGRGGAIVTPHADVAQRIRIYSQRGNEAFPLSELQAAVLAPQVEKLSLRNALRADAASRLVQQLADINDWIASASPTAGTSPAYYKLGLFLRPAENADDAETAARVRRRFIAAAQAEGVAIDEGFRGFARRSAARCRVAGTLLAAQRAAQCTLVVHHPALLAGHATIDRIAGAMRKVVAALRSQEAALERPAG